MEGVGASADRGVSGGDAAPKCWVLSTEGGGDVAASRGLLHLRQWRENALGVSCLGLLAKHVVLAIVSYLRDQFVLPARARTDWSSEALSYM